MERKWLKWAKNALKIDFIYDVMIRIIVCRCVMKKKYVFFCVFSQKDVSLQKINKRKTKSYE